MAVKSLRILHAANLQLDCPLRTTGPLEDEIREIVESATLLAFERIITTAIEKNVDALLITGNTFDASYPSLAAEVALWEGFNRLNERQIPVLIAPGKLDPVAAWLELPRLPSNVTIFENANGTPVELTNQGKLLAIVVPVVSESAIEPHHLIGLLNGRMTAQGDRPFVIGMLLTDRITDHSHQPKQVMARQAAIDWLACPTGIDGISLPIVDDRIHAQSAPQGMSRLETGARGVTLLEVDAQRKTKITRIAVAPVRWESFQQSIDQHPGQDQLLERMLSQFEKLPHVNGEQLRLIEWQLDRSAGDAHGWQSDATASELAEHLTRISDQPDGLRCLHCVIPLESDLTLIEPAHREVLTEYLLALQHRAPETRATFGKWLSQAGVGDVVNGGWEHWAETITPEQVTERANQLGWKWFSSIAKK